MPSVNRNGPWVPAASGQRGAASLVVVMLLLFVVGLTAAYSARSLIFEQRTGANQYAATQAFEAAEAGLEWALAMLNAGRVDDACRADVATAADPTFRQRYLAISPANGNLTVLAPGGVALTPSCVLDGAGGAAPAWRCSCPRNGAPALASPAGDAVAPAFRVRFVADPLRADVVRIESNGCTRLDGACLNFPSQAVAGAARASVSVLARLTSALPSPPVAALTVAGNVAPAGPAFRLVNDLPGNANLTLHVGGAFDLATTAMQVYGPPGMPAPDTVLADAGLRPPALPAAGAQPAWSSADRFFVAVFGIAPSLYESQPAALRLNCGDAPADCRADALRTLAAMNPGRVVWADGDVDLDTDGDIGTPAEPLLLVVNGRLTVSAADARLNGVAYVRTVDWTTAGAGRVRGAVIAEGNVDGAGTTVVTYDRAVVDRLWRTHGSFVRVPGSWRDF